MNDHHHGLTDTLNAISEEAGGDEQITIGDMVETLNSRGYGPLMIAPAIITILPTGAIPGVPAICASLIIFISAQMLIGRDNPWLPRRMKDFSFSRTKLSHALGKIKPHTKFVDSLVYPRLTFMTREEIKPLIALSSIFLAIGIIILGWIPFLPLLPAIGILLLGLGLSTRDGLLIITALGVACGSAMMLYAMWTRIFGG